MPDQMENAKHNTTFLSFFGRTPDFKGILPYEAECSTKSAMGSNVSWLCFTKYKITSFPSKVVHLFADSLNSSFIYFYLKLKT